MVVRFDQESERPLDTNSDKAYDYVLELDVVLDPDATHWCAGLLPMKFER